MGHGEMNGHPSWPQFVEVLDRGLDRTGQHITYEVGRLHDRLTASEGVLHRRIDGVREEVVRLGATIAAQQSPAPAPPPPGRFARAKAWTEQVAALRELLLLLCLAIAGLTAVVQAPEIKSGLREAAGLIASHRSLHLKPLD